MSYLVCMRSGHEKNWPVSRDLPRSARVYFSKEGVGEDGHDPEEGVIFPIAHGVELLRTVLAARILRAHARRRNTLASRRSHVGGLIHAAVWA